MKVTYKIESDAILATVGFAPEYSVVISPGVDASNAITVLCRMLAHDLTLATKLESAFTPK
jgi:hypothetical protein